MGRVIENNAATCEAPDVAPGTPWPFVGKGLPSGMTVT